MTKVWEKNDWQLKKQGKKEYLLFYREQLKLQFPQEFISLYEVTFLPREDYMELRSIGQTILKVMK